MFIAAVLFASNDAIFPAKKHLPRNHRPLAKEKQIPSQPKVLQKMLFQKNCFGTINSVKIQIPSHVLLQTGTNQWQQHYKEHAQVEVFFVIITKIVIEIIVPRHYFVILSARMVNIKNFGRTPPGVWVCVCVSRLSRGHSAS